MALSALEKMPTGAELFIATIQQFGIEKIFTLVGDHLNPVLSVASRKGVEIIHMRHEAAVVHADSDAGRLHGKTILVPDGQ